MIGVCGQSWVGVSVCDAGIWKRADCVWGYISIPFITPMVTSPVSSASVCPTGDNSWKKMRKQETSCPLNLHLSLMTAAQLDQLQPEFRVEQLLLFAPSLSLSLCYSQKEITYVEDKSLCNERVNPDSASSGHTCLWLVSVWVTSDSSQRGWCFSVSMVGCPFP